MEHIRAFIRSIHPISDRTFEALESVLRPETFKRGDFFAEEGKKAHRIGFVRSGVLRGFCQIDGHQEYTRNFFVAPRPIGAFTSLVTGSVNQLSIQALTDCEVWTGKYEDYLRMYDEYPDFDRLGRRFAELLFVTMEKREIELVTLSAKERYVKFQKDYPDLAHSIPLYHIASYLGITPTQLSRIRASR